MKERFILLFIAIVAVGCAAFGAPSAHRGVVSDSSKAASAGTSPGSMPDTVHGVVSDSSCGLRHSKASEAATECVKKCVDAGAKYVVVSKGKVYQVDSQAKFADFAGKAVTVHGRISGDTIAVWAVHSDLRAREHHVKHPPSTTSGSGGG